MLASRENYTWVVEEEPKKPTQELEDVNLVEGELLRLQRWEQELTQT